MQPEPDLPDEPTFLYSEVGVDGYELRKVEEYETGRQDFAGPGVQRGRSHRIARSRGSELMIRSWFSASPSSK